MLLKRGQSAESREREDAQFQGSALWFTLLFLVQCMVLHHASRLHSSSRVALRGLFDHTFFFFFLAVILWSAGTKSMRWEAAQHRDCIRMLNGVVSATPATYQISLFFFSSQDKLSPTRPWKSKGVSCCASLCFLQYFTPSLLFVLDKGGRACWMQSDESWTQTKKLQEDNDLYTFFKQFYYIDRLVYNLHLLDHITLRFY